jgi:mitochondrial enoyl-[acyl-carrier protein] reductase / trans-2-enoyl-CoA reductase
MSVKETITAVVYQAHGNPAEVLKLEEQSRPKANPDEAVVRMLSAPINPADINVIEGKYPVRLPCPATPGMEGGGVVEEVGNDVSAVKVGDHVILPHNIGTWREAVALAATQLVVAPREIDPVQLGMLKIDPLTAWRLLHGYVPLNRGDWIVQNAGNSGAGRAVIQIAHELGYKTINLVRRPELIEELKKEGADVVLVDDENVRDAVKSATGGAPIRLGLNAVGGESALRVANTLAPDGTVVTYGAMSLQPLKIPNGLLIFKNLNFRGIWINKWYDNASAAERKEAFDPIFDMVRRGLLQSRVEKRYAIKDAKDAVTRAMQSQRNGKIVFDFVQ